MALSLKEVADVLAQLTDGGKSLRYGIVVERKEQWFVLTPFITDSVK